MNYRVTTFLVAFAIHFTGCATGLERRGPLDEFYRYAKARMAGRTTAPPPLGTLDVAISAIPGCGGYPAIDESSIIVSDPASKDPRAVQVIVNPRVSGSFLDPTE